MVGWQTNLLIYFDKISKYWLCLRELPRTGGAPMRCGLRRGR